MFFFKRELSRIIREFPKIIISFNLRLIYGNYTFFFKRKLSRIIRDCETDEHQRKYEMSE